MIKWLKRIVALLVSERVAELELELAQRNAEIEALETKLALASIKLPHRVSIASKDVW